jgi:hypothetical protein
MVPLPDFAPNVAQQTPMGTIRFVLSEARNIDQVAAKLSETLPFQLSSLAV